MPVPESAKWSHSPPEVDGIIEEVEDIISAELIGMDAEDLQEIDLVLKEIDGTENLSAIGGNTTVAVSMAVAKAAAASYNLPLYRFLGGNMPSALPFPLGNMINGGAHAGKNAPDIQEFLVLPVGADNITEAVFTNVAVHRRIREKKSPPRTPSSLEEKETKEDGHPTSPTRKHWKSRQLPVPKSLTKPGYW